MEKIIQFLKEWQTLIGVFCAAMLSVFIFLIKNFSKNRRNYKEYLRQIEISTTQSLNDIYVLRSQLEYFIGKVKELEEEINKITSPIEFFLGEINFPITREIYWGKNLSNFKVKSYYLHNKILWADAGIKDINKIIRNLENDFKEMKGKNRELVILGKIDQEKQRETYRKSLTSFREAIDKFIPETLLPFIEIVVQIKFYNDKMRKINGCWFLWKMEKDCRFSKDKDIENMKIVDFLIKEKVKKITEEGEVRYRSNQK